MPHVDSPLKSRVQEVRTHGLKESPALTCWVFNLNARQGRSD
jgi:hypothetical protein